MKEEYIIISKTAIEKRIEELETIEAKLMNEGMSYVATRAKIDELYYLLHQSTPLIPEIEKAFDEGKGVGIISYQPQGHTIDKELYNERKKHYISNLKLDI